MVNNLLLSDKEPNRRGFGDTLLAAANNNNSSDLSPSSPSSSTMSSQDVHMNEAPAASDPAPPTLQRTLPRRPSPPPFLG